MRKLLSVILALVMVLSVFTPVFAEEAPKATEAPEAAPTAAPTMAKHIEFLKEQGIIQGDKTGNLMLDQNIDRASFAAILVRAAGKEATAESVKTLAPRFKDLTVAHWANGYATVALESNLMKGNPAGEFMPGKQISYAEIATTLVRFLGKEKAGFVYPTSYIAAATELGLFKDVEIGGAFTANATRDNVFKMLYNAVSKEDFGRYNVYKVMFLENDRVAQLGADELNAEVISIVQIANKVSERGTTAKIGQKFVLNVKDVKVENGLADTENLIGKVADVTLDENNKLVKVAVDKKNYEYLYGEFVASKDGKTFEIADRKFNVRFDERYYNAYSSRDMIPYQRSSERDDRVYRTYVTSGKRAENFNYITFAERLNLEKGQRDKINANFARVTVKDGMVLFVDAYNYTDIAPVKSNDKGVYYWNDARDAAVERMIPARRVIGFTEKDGFRKIKADDIKADDVIHWMDGFTLVRQDAKLDSKLVKTLIARNGEWGVFKVGEKDEEIYLNSYSYQDQPFNSVFAYDDQHYKTLKSREFLKDMVGSDVKALLDVFGNLQLITSHEKFTDRLALVNKAVSSKGMEFYLPNAPEQTRFRLNDGWDSNYYKNGVWNADKTGTTQEKAYAKFSRLDLVYTAADKDDNVKVVAVIEGFDWLDRGQRYSGKDWHYARFSDERRNELTVDRPYRYTDETEVFVINKDADGNRINVVEKVTIADALKYNKDNRDLQAVVLTEKEYAKFLGDINVSTYGRYDDERDDLIKAVIFTNYKGPQADLGQIEYGRIVKIYNWSNEVDIEVADRTVEKFVIHPASKVNMKNKGKVGQFVKFRRVKDSDPLTARFDEVIVPEVKGTIFAYKNNKITLTDGREFYTWKHTKEFDIALGNKNVAMHVDGQYVEFIKYNRDSDKTTSNVEDELAKINFIAAVTKAKASKSVADISNALTLYNALTDDVKANDKVKASKEELDKLVQDVVYDKSYENEYKVAVLNLKKFDMNKSAILADASKKASVRRAALEEAKKLLEAASDLHGKNKVPAADPIEATVQGKVTAAELDIVKAEVAEMQSALNKYVADKKAEIARVYAQVDSKEPLYAALTAAEGAVKAYTAKTLTVPANTNMNADNTEYAAIDTAKTEKEADMKAFDALVDTFEALYKAR